MAKASNNSVLGGSHWCASLAGLQPGDVIVTADRQPVSSVAELEQVLAKAKDKSQVLLRITRQGQSLFVVLQMK